MRLRPSTQILSPAASYGAIIELQLHRRMHFEAVTCIETTLTMWYTPFPLPESLRRRIGENCNGTYRTLEYPDYLLELESENTVKRVCISLRIVGSSGYPTQRR